MLTKYLKQLLQQHNLTEIECADALEIMLTLENPIQIGAFLSLMRAKGETATEIAGFVSQMQKHQISINVGFPVLDIVGTGGDAANTANISTSASILAASCGVPVLKHGNRAVSSKSGAADVLEALGLNLQQTPEQVTQSVKQHSIGFCFAPNFHPALLTLKPIRSALKIPTFFNLLGPLLNPGKAEYMVLGVFSVSTQKLMAEVLSKLGIKRAMIVFGNGLDELSCLGPCDVIEITEGKQQHYTLDPLQLGLPRCELNDLIGGDAQHNAKLLQQVVENKQSGLANTAILNAAAAVYIYGKTQDIFQGIQMVRENIANGRAKQTLESFIHA